MVRVSTKPTALLATLLLLGTMAYGQTQDWPLKRAIDLSSGFGDFRANRFHAGVDLRTGGRIGVKVYSPVDGYVWRVKMSYRGYGKGLYIKGTDDHFYVVGHLSRFNDVIQAAVRDRQFEHQRYYVDIYFPEDSIPIKKGELIAYSGKTGAGAPHLHFEKRSPDNVPLNPLSHGFTLNDTVPPTFERIGFHLQDDRSLFPNGRRKLFLPVRKIAEGKYRLDTVLYLNSEFGLLVDCYDQKRPGGMRQSIYQLTLSVDGVPVYDAVLDSLPFEVGPTVSLVFDPLEAANGEKRVRRLYHLYDSIRDTRWAMGPMHGLINLSGTADTGRHILRVEALDNAGNSSTLEVGIRFGEKNVTVGKPVLASGPSWLDYEVTERGIAVRQTGSSKDSIQNIFVYEDPADWGTPGDLDLLQLLAMAPADVTIHRLGNDDSVTFWNEFTTVVPVNGLFRARTVAIEKIGAIDSLKLPLASEVYRILPEAFAVRREFRVSIKLSPGAPTNPHTGLCWYDKKEEEWVWIDEGTANADLAAGSSLGGGLFAAIIDTTAPTITGLNLKAGHKYYNRQPDVKFILEDNLSGFENDLSIDIRIDGEWLLPELDTEDGECLGTLRNPLDLGRHKLLIAVEDRAGNRTEQQIEFDVIKRNN